jgi:dienelactone hydrolase
LNNLGVLWRYFVVFLLTLCVGIAFQLLVSFTVPQVQVASLDGGTFRSWSGLGIRETIVLAGLVATLSVFGVQHNQRPDGTIASNIVLVLVGCSIGSPITLVTAMLALRLTVPVVGVWAMQIVLQIVAAGLSAAWLAGHSARVAAFASLVAILVTSGCLSVAYAYPTPLPDETFVVQLPGVPEIHVDCFLPEGEGPYPAVVIFHGVEGATNLTRRAVHYPNAKSVSQQGYATFLVRYFDSCPYEHLMLIDEGSLNVEEIEKIRIRDYQTWIDAAGAALHAVHDREDVGDMAVIGYSLGCYVGSAATSRTSLKGYPKAFVGNFGGIWREIDIPPTYPPTRFYHGKLDTIVPISNAEQALLKLKTAGIENVELFAYPDQAHIPEGPTSSVIRASTEDFLYQHLRGP